MWQRVRWKWRRAVLPRTSAPARTPPPPARPARPPLILTRIQSDKIRASYEHYAKRLHYDNNEWPDRYFNIVQFYRKTFGRIKSQYSTGRLRIVIRKLFPRPGETSLGDTLRSALRPGEFKMTSMGRWLLVASLAECVDILWVSNTTWFCSCENDARMTNGRASLAA